MNAQFRRTLYILVFGLCCLSQAAFGQVDFDALNAQENFREGVVRFHRGSYNEAILSLQRSLSFVADDPLTRLWLGRAYYFSGYVDAALDQWQRLEDEGLAPPFLRSAVDTILASRSLASELQEDREYLVVERFQAQEYPSSLLFPAGVLPDGKGRILYNSFGSNELGILSQSGRFLAGLNGGFRPLLGPFDAALYAGELYVTNFLGDYVSVLNSEGDTLRQFGGPGIGDGELLGPKYISVSGEPAVYVADYGNQRIVKYSSDGEYLFHFGQPAAFRTIPSEFEGFEGIGGLTVSNQNLFVADNRQDGAVLYRFDYSGNVLERFELPGLSDVEDLAVMGEGRLLITTRNEVFSFDPRVLSLKSLHRSIDEENSQYVSSAIDDNGNLIISDFRNGELLYLSRLSGLYSGYQVEILRVDSSSFPLVNMEVSVRDMFGREVLGLEAENFILSEDGLPLEDHELLYSGSFDQYSSAAIILEASSRRGDSLFSSRQRDAVQQILDYLPEASELRVFSAGVSPVLEWDSDDSPEDIPAVVRSIGADQQWRLDQSIRLAGDRLLLDQAKREILFVGSGSLPDWAFETIGLNQSLEYLLRNHIRFNVVQVGQAPIDSALVYLSQQSGGTVYNPFGGEGLADLTEQFLSRRDGIYLLQIQSLFDPDFGRKYLPIEVEVSHFSKSGRDESGYFGPLQF